MKYYILTIACILFGNIKINAADTERKIFLNKPAKMNKSLKGNPQSTWIISKSAKIPGEPYNVYRCSADIKLQTTAGKVMLLVRQINKNGKSICYSKIATLTPSILDFNKYSNIFFTNKDTAHLQVYYRLVKVSGSATFRNLILEKLSKTEADKALAAMKVPPVYFSLPVYCYDDDTELKWGYRVNINLNQEGKNIRKIVLECPEKKLRTEIIAGKGNQLNSIDRQFPQGTYHLTAKALDKSGKVLGEETVLLKSVKKVSARNCLPIKNINIDGNNILRVNGEAVFPMGIYHVYTSAQMKQVKRQGFNCIQVWSPDIPGFKRNLDLALSNGLMGFCRTKMLGDEKLKALTNAIKNHPANLMWDLVDEPSLRNIYPQKVKGKADIIRGLDRNRPIRISFGDTSQAVKYEKCLDIVATHCYPVPFGKVTEISKCMDLLSKNFADRRPLHFTLQAWIHHNDPKKKEQSVAQTRAMTYLAINHGAKGLYYLSFIGSNDSWDIRKYPRLWSTFIGLTYEIETLSKIILEGKRIKQISISPAVIDAGVMEYAGNRYVIAVNTAEKDIDMKLSVSDWEKFKLQEMFSDKNIEIYKSKNGFEDKFAPLQTKIFKISR
jgi:hypothetical protein